MRQHAFTTFALLVVQIGTPFTRPTGAVLLFRRATMLFMSHPSADQDHSAPVLLPFDRLSAAQQQILAAPTDGETVVGGVPGSGKTLAAVHRALHLAAEPRARGLAVLFLCFNKALAARVAGLVDQADDAIARRIKVRTVHQWCYPAVKRRFPRAEVINDQCKAELLLAAVDEVRREHGAVQPDGELRFWLDAVHYAKGVGNTASGDTFVAAVVAAYDRRLRDANLLDFDDFATIALADPRERAAVDHVIVDEAQDLSALQLDLCRAVARRGLLVVADQQQAIYQVTRLPESLPPPDAYDLFLAADYRTTAEIAALAGRLVPRPAGALPMRHGPAPSYHRFAWSDEEADFVATTIAALLAAGTPPATIAVIVRMRELLPPFRNALAQAAVSVAHDEQPGVVLTTIHEAKGREFGTVFVAGLVEGVLPRVMPEMDRAAVRAELALARRQLYVVLTRAGERLFLSSSEGPPSRLLAELGFADPEERL